MSGKVTSSRQHNDSQLGRIHGLLIPQGDALRLHYAIERGNTLDGLVMTALNKYCRLPEPPPPAVDSGEVKMIVSLPLGMILALKQTPGHDPRFNVTGIVRSSLRNLAADLPARPDEITINDVWTRPRRRRRPDLAAELGRRIKGVGVSGLPGEAPAW